MKVEKVYIREMSAWLNKQQIKGFFSRLAKQRRKGLHTVEEEGNLECENDEKEDEEREELLNDINY